MEFDHQRLRDDLQDLADLPSSTSADPAPEIHRRVRRARRRRTAGVAVLAVSAVAAVALVAGPTLGALRTTGSEPGYAGSPQATNTTRGTPTMVSSVPTTPPPSFPLPEPWSDREFTKEPERNMFRPAAYYINQGEVQGRDWAVLALNEDGSSPGCLAVEPNDVFDTWVCYDEWPAGRRLNWTTTNAFVGTKPNLELLPATLVMGAVSVDARTVDIKVAGKVYHADAVGTPASNRLRFFAIVVPVVDASPGEVVPRMANGEVAPPPVGLPEHGEPCMEGKPGDCAQAERPGEPKSSDTKASGPGYEEYTPGKHGVGYIVNEGDGASAVSYRENGDGAACLAAQPNETYDNAVLCFGDNGQPSGQGVLWKEIPGTNGGKVVMGMLMNETMTQVELLDASGKSLGRVSAVQTPTTNLALFFMTVVPDDVEVAQVKALR